jgi:hypothetical protein
MNDFARTLRSSPTEAERLLWYRLRRRWVGGFRFRRQVPIGRVLKHPDDVLTAIDAALVDPKMSGRLD